MKIRVFKAARLNLNHKLSALGAKLTQSKFKRIKLILKKYP